MGRPTPGVSGRELHKIMRRRGCELVRTTGGHSHWRAPDGTRLTVVGAGRQNGPTFREVAQVAKALDTTIEELLAS